MLRVLFSINDGGLRSTVVDMGLYEDFVLVAMGKLSYSHSNEKIARKMNLHESFFYRPRTINQLHSQLFQFDPKPLLYFVANIILYNTQKTKEYASPVAIYPYSAPSAARMDSASLVLLIPSVHNHRTEFQR